ncbi:hypothetical protein LY78DRAFT_234586 [Colletotrichum sublineola]|nr:hypothetical protein LY78DRAFT_234586 [Colletotrichum sublineola]
MIFRGEGSQQVDLLNTVFNCATSPTTASLGHWQTARASMSTCAAYHWGRSLGTCRVPRPRPIQLTSCHPFEPRHHSWARITPPPSAVPRLWSRRPLHSSQRKAGFTYPHRNMADLAPSRDFVAPAESFLDETACFPPPPSISSHLQDLDFWNLPSRSQC